MFLKQADSIAALGSFLLIISIALLLLTETECKSTEVERSAAGGGDGTAIHPFVADTSAEYFAKEGSAAVTGKKAAAVPDSPKAIDKKSGGGGGGKLARKQKNVLGAKQQATFKRQYEKYPQQQRPFSIRHYVTEEDFCGAQLDGLWTTLDMYSNSLSGMWKIAKKIIETIGIKSTSFIKSILNTSV
jgi:hypothetical protein